MKDLKDLLQKFQSFGLTEHKIKDSLIEILKEDLNLNLERKHLELKDRRLRVMISGPVKTGIVLKKNQILEKLNSKIEKTGVQVLDIN